jgi:hypothetical protein
MQPGLRDAFELSRVNLVALLGLPILLPPLIDRRLLVWLIQAGIDGYSWRIERQLEASRAQGICNPIGAMAGSRHEV